MVGRVISVAFLTAVVLVGGSASAAHSTAAVGNGLIAGLVGGQIVIGNPDGTSRFTIPRGEHEGFPIEAGPPSWSPDGARIAFVGKLCPRGGGTCRPGQLFTMSWDGSGLRAIAEIWVIGYGPSGYPQKVSWSPWGDELAVVTRDAAARAYIAVVRADGSGRRAVTEPERDVSVREPYWSPDGRTIAYQRHRLDDAGWEIRLVEAAGGSPRLLHRTPGHLGSWSPDGSRLLFDDGSELLTVSSSTSETGPVVAGRRTQLSAVSTTWSPDGASLLSSGNVYPLDGALPRGVGAIGAWTAWQPCHGTVPCRLRVPAVTLARLAIVPPVPKSGGVVTITSTLLADGKPIRAETSCIGHVGSVPLTVVRSSGRDQWGGRGFVGCSWKLPRGVAGLKATLRLRVAADKTVARVPVLTRTAVVRIR